MSWGLTLNDIVLPSITVENNERGDADARVINLYNLMAQIVMTTRSRALFVLMTRWEA